MKTRVIGVSLPENLITRGKEVSAERGVSFSSFVAICIANEVGENPPSVFCHGGAREGAGAKHGGGCGGDLARYKTAETHARVCAKMREAKAIKRVREEAKKRIATATKRVERGAA